MRALRGALAAMLCACTEAQPTPSAPAPIERAPIEPAPNEPAANERDDAWIFEASGDLVLNALAMRAVRGAESESDGYHALLDGYARALEPGALTYLNLEMPLVDDRRDLDSGWPRSRTDRPRRAPVLGGSPALATVLRALGVELVGLANNHALDQGHGGLAATEAALDEAGLVHAGTGTTREAAYAPAWIDHAGGRIAFFSATEPMNQRAHDLPPRFIARLDTRGSLLREAIARARSEADLVIVALHWSTDFVMEVAPWQRRLAQELVDAGADVIVGTGPHVLQPVERLPSPRGEALVAYSLGNVASGMGRAYRFGEVPETYIHPANVVPEARDGVVLSVRIARGERLAMRAELRLLFTENDWLIARDAAPPHLAVRPLGELPAACADRLPSMRRALGEGFTLVPDACP